MASRILIGTTRARGMRSRFLDFAGAATTLTLLAERFDWTRSAPYFSPPSPVLGGVITPVGGAALATGGGCVAVAAAAHTIVNTAEALAWPASTTICACPLDFGKAVNTAVATPVEPMTGAVGVIVPRSLRDVKRTKVPSATSRPNWSRTVAKTDAWLPQPSVAGVTRRVTLAGGPATGQTMFTEISAVAVPACAAMMTGPLKPKGSVIATDARPLVVPTMPTVEVPIVNVTGVLSGTFTPASLTSAVTVKTLPQTTLPPETERLISVAASARGGGPALSAKAPITTTNKTRAGNRHDTITVSLKLGSPGRPQTSTAARPAAGLRGKSGEIYTEPKVNAGGAAFSAPLHSLALARAKAPLGYLSPPSPVFGGVMTPVDGGVVAIGGGASVAAGGGGVAVAGPAQVTVSEPVATPLPAVALIWAVPGVLAEDVSTAVAWPLIVGAVGVMLPSDVVKETSWALATRLPKRSRTVASTEAVLPQVMFVGVISSVIEAGGPVTSQVTESVIEAEKGAAVAVTIRAPLRPMGAVTVTVATPPDVVAETGVSPMLLENRTTVPSATGTPAFSTVAETEVEAPQARFVATAVSVISVLRIVPVGNTVTLAKPDGAQPEPWQARTEKVVWDPTFGGE